MSKDRQAAREAKLLIAMINNEGSNKKDTEKVKQYILEPKNISLCSETQNAALSYTGHPFTPTDNYMFEIINKYYQKYDLQNANC